MNFTKILNHEITTLNGDKAFSSTGSIIFDLFSTNCRIMKADFNKAAKLLSLMEKAFAHNKKETIAILMNAIDVREGKGERTFADLVVQFLSKNAPSFLINNMEKIIDATRWDIFFRNFIWLPPIIQKKVITVIKNNDKLKKPNLLMYKWLPSINANGSLNTKQNAIAIAKALKKSPKKYRKWLSSKRKLLNLIETNLTNKRYDKINVEVLPKKALTMYGKVLNKKISDKMEKYFKDIEKGKIKTNISILNPIDILVSNLESNQKDVLWEKQTNYLAANFFPVIDVSASMTVPVAPKYSALNVAVTLGIYASDFNQSSFKNKVMIFSKTAKVLDLSNEKFSEKVEIIKKNSETANTNLDNVYETFLNTALLVPAKLRKEAVPKQILIITDGQFDDMVDKPNTSALERWIKKYQEAKIAMPKIVFWNINAPLKSYPFKVGSIDITMISGFSPKILTLLSNLEAEELNNMILKELFEKYFKKFDFSVI